MAACITSVSWCRASPWWPSSAAFRGFAPCKQHSSTTAQNPRSVAFKYESLLVSVPKSAADVSRLPMVRQLPSTKRGSLAKAVVLHERLRWQKEGTSPCIQECVQ